MKRSAADSARAVSSAVAGLMPMATLGNTNVYAFR